MGAAEKRATGDFEWEWVLDPDGWSGSSSLLICCLSCYRRESDDHSAPGEPHALIAPFARAHYYRAAIGMLRAFAVRLEAVLGVPRARVRFFSNSRIPEKPLLAASGLGTYGKNSLTIVPGLGSLFIIAGAVIPLPTARLLPAAAAPSADPCGACRRCMEACPAQALVQAGVVDPDRCMQAAASSATVLSADAMRRWGVRLYGCQSCQDACPHNGHLTAEAAPACGETGPSLPLRRLLGADVRPSGRTGTHVPGGFGADPDGLALKGLFRGTAMGMSWIDTDALLRNALIAAGNRGEASLRSAVERFTDAATPAVRVAARWSLQQLGS
jgi:epoxyqueuosine reductase